MKIDMKKKRVLITLYYADGLHGGVKYSAELGSFFISIGYEVYVAGVLVSKEVKKYFAEKNMVYFDIKKTPLDIEYDIVWVHAFPTLPFLVKRGLKYKRIINSCISDFLPIDKPVFLHEKVDLILTLTDENRNFILNNYNISTPIKVLPNTAPDVFFDVCKEEAKLKRVAVVSNHPPQEILEAMKLLKKKGLECILFGSSNKNSVDITPELLSQFDSVISIGKTVQYCLAAGIPVYNYDHFGGSGYITLENFEGEEKSNFSGRSFFIKKEARIITNELLDMYENVYKQKESLKKIAKSRYKLSTRISEILFFLDNSPQKPKIEINNENRLFFDYCDFIILSIRNKELEKEFCSVFIKLLSIFIPVKRWRKIFRKKFMH